MTYADRWLLPDGVEELLPDQARQLESLRRRLLDLYRCWGYDLVIPPLVEFTDSLLIGLGRDLDLLTFKLTDQLSGRALGVRADITPQTARMDAHSLKRQGANRLCYAGHVLHTRPRTPLATRSPMLAGVELYGEAGQGADLEVISLLLESLQAVGLHSASVEIGHVGICRELIKVLDLDDHQRETLFDLLQRKAAAEMRAWVEEHVQDSAIAEILRQLPRLAGGRESLRKARDVLAKAPAAVMDAVHQLESLADTIVQRYPDAQLYFDLSELHSFSYHTGLWFAAFTPGYGRALASGGRYDHVGQVFGRARPATGFHIDVTALNRLLNAASPRPPGIYAPDSEDPRQWEAVRKLRSKGQIVVGGFPGETPDREELNCDRRLVLKDGEYQVETWR
ncbi:ATP phosphoribosyltransferase regulatory subunit [Gilvimarinus sp. F26214L]|uniref:ATP phosphoribosyltransferase regulatory subunit n=1 Tax=Gilvimarinus sp. DZF01 TaxID=3461371 RepID=UPI004045D670